MFIFLGWRFRLFHFSVLITDKACNDVGTYYLSQINSVGDSKSTRDFLKDRLCFFAMMCKWHSLFLGHTHPYSMSLRMTENSELSDVSETLNLLKHTGICLQQDQCCGNGFVFLWDWPSIALQFWDFSGSSNHFASTDWSKF